MKRVCAVVACVALVAAVAAWRAPVRAAEGPYKLLTEIKIGTDGGWDYASVDSSSKRLFVSHATSVVVIDTEKNTVVGQIGPTPGVHGIAVAPELGKAFVSNGRENKAAIVDLKTLKIVASVETGPNPDAILYEPAHREVYTFNGNGKALGSVPIGEGVDANAFDPGTGYAFASSSDGTMTVAKVDAAGTLVVVQKLATPLRTRTMTLDPATHRLYAAAAEYKPGQPGPDGKPSRPTVVPGTFRVMVYELVK